MKKYIRQNRRVYDDLASQYGERVSRKSPYEIDFDFLVDSLMKKYVSLYKQVPEKILELGPGAGETLCAFSRKGCSTTAIEFSEKMANVARQNSPQTVFILEDALSFRGFGEEQFDIVFAGAFMHLFSIEDEKTLLRKIRKWMSDKSLFGLYTTVHEMSEEGLFLKSDYSSQLARFRRKWNREDLQEFLICNGFKILDAFENCEANRNKQWITLILKKN